MKKSVSTRESLSTLAIAASMVLLISSHTANAQNVGIGTPTPGSKLSVAGNAVIGLGYAGLAGPTDGLAIQGNVGIGTTAPWAKLHVIGDTRIGLVKVDQADAGVPGYGDRLFFSGGPHTSYPNWNSDNSDPLWIARYNVAFDATELRINVGDGSSPSDKMVIGTTTASWSPVMTVQMDGNVGIGTTAPAQKLHVVGVVRVSSLAANALVRSNTNGDLSTINLSGSPNDVLRGDGTFGNITSTGAVTGTGVATRVAFWNSNNSLSSDANLYWDNTNKRLGIGTAAPGYKLTIAGAYDIFAVDNTASFLAKNASGTYERYLWPRWSDNVMYLNYGSGGFNIRNNSSATTMFMTNSGNVGIGTTAPGQKLDVSGNIRATGEIIGTLGSGYGQFRAIAGNYGFMLRNDGTNTYFLLTASGNQYGIWNTLRPFFINNASGNVSIGNNALYVQHAGNVGVGTTAPSEKLEIKGNVMINNGGSDGARLIWRGGSGGTKEYRARVYTDGTLSFFPIELGNPGYVGHVLVLTQSGNVGIGTAATAPAHKLELSVDDAAKPGSNTWTVISDERLKNIVGKYSKGLKEILQLNPILYYYKNSDKRTFAEPVLKIQNVGFSAQEVQKVFPEAVSTDPDGYLNLNIHAILVAYTNAIKELKAELDKLTTINEQLTIQNAELKSRLERIEQMLATMAAENK